MRTMKFPPHMRYDINRFDVANKVDTGVFYYINSKCMTIKLGSLRQNKLNKVCMRHCAGICTSFFEGESGKISLANYGTVCLRFEQPIVIGQRFYFDRKTSMMTPNQNRKCNRTEIGIAVSQNDADGFVLIEFETTKLIKGD